MCSCFTPTCRPEWRHTERLQSSDNETKEQKYDGWMKGGTPRCPLLKETPVLTSVQRPSLVLSPPADPCSFARRSASVHFVALAQIADDGGGVEQRHPGVRVHQIRRQHLP